MTAWDSLAARRTGIPVFAPGHVWLAGAGPGDPGLLTLDALAGLAQADIVVHDALVDQRVLALAGPQARLEFAGKRGGKPSALQADISERLIALARAGNRVLRLKGGDPFVFGRGGEEAITLARAGVPFRIIPGVTAGLAALFGSYQASPPALPRWPRPESRRRCAASIAPWSSPPDTARRKISIGRRSRAPGSRSCCTW